MSVARHRALGAQTNEVPFELRRPSGTRGRGAARDAAMQPGDVAVFREQNVTALVAPVNAGSGTGKELPVVSRPMTNASDDVALGRATEALDARGPTWLALELFERDDFCRWEDVAELAQTRLVRADLQVHAVERAFVLDVEWPSVC